MANEDWKQPTAIITGTIAYFILYVVLSVVVTIVIGCGTKKDTAEVRKGHIQYVACSRNVFVQTVVK